MSVQTFCGNGPDLLLWNGSRAALGKTLIGVPNFLNHYVILVVYIVVHIVYKCGRELHNTTWRVAGWGHMIQNETNQNG